MEIEKRAALLRSQLNKQIGIDRFAYWFAHMMPSMVAGVFSGDWRGDDTFLDPGKEAIDALRIAGFDTAQLKGKRKADFEASCRGTFVNRFDDRNVEKTLAQNLCLLLRFGSYNVLEGFECLKVKRFDAYGLENDENKQVDTQLLAEALTPEFNDLFLVTAIELANRLNLPPIGTSKGSKGNKSR